MTTRKTAKKEAEESTEVAVVEQGSTDLAAWGDFSGKTGLEDIGANELAIPFINVLQSNSEMVEDGKAQAGQFHNTVMDTVTDDLVFIPCARDYKFIEWVPHDDGGGLVGIHEP